MPEVTLSGCLVRKVGPRRRMWSAYYSIRADNKIPELSGTRLESCKIYLNNVKLNFEKLLDILGLAGVSGLEGMKPEGAWAQVRLLPSNTCKVVKIKVPLPDGSFNELTIRGNVEVGRMLKSDWRNDVSFEVTEC